MQMNDSQNTGMGKRFDDYIRRHSPLAAFAVDSCGSVGQRVTGVIGRRAASGITALLLVATTPVLAQQGGGVSCGSGILGFIGALQSLTVQSAGMIIVAMLIVAGLAKMMPVQGTNRLGNALIGSVIVGLVFFVFGYALVDIAGGFVPISLNPQCGG